MKTDIVKGQIMMEKNMRHVKIPGILLERVKELEEFYKDYYPKAVPLIKNCFLNTMETTMYIDEAEKVFVITGDIPAMWLRDSYAQIHPYIKYADRDEELFQLLVAVWNRQLEQVQIDSYANAFNAQANGRGWSKDHTKHNPWVWERKYEVDSLCAPIALAYDLYMVGKKKEIFRQEFYRVLEQIISQWELEQHHEKSDYYFERLSVPETDTLPNAGRGNPVDYTGMTWSGFRPSDDRCVYGYLIPSNMYACSVLKKAVFILREVYQDKILSERCDKLREAIHRGIHRFGVVENEKYGPIFAYETDGRGNYVLMDDANVPSLLAIPYFGYLKPEEELYKNTRKFLLSKENPFFYQGKYAEGIGSPHTPLNHVWPISIIMQALTSNDKEEKMKCLDILTHTHAGTNFVHESFHVDEPSKYTRKWFAWANSLFGELLDEEC